MKNIQRTHGFEPLKVDGCVPAELRGTLFRTGPGLFERFGTKINHPFEADGVVTAVRFDADGTSGAARIVKSEGFKQEERAGKFLYNSSAGLLDYLSNARRGETKTTGNTSMFWWQDRLFALMEGGKPQEMDPATLETRDAVDLGGVIKGAFSAHPHRVAALDTHFNFGVRYGRRMEVDLYALPCQGKARHMGSFEAPWSTMIHDFAATEKHLIFIIAPAQLVTWRALTRIGGFSKLFRWEPDAGCQILRIPLAHPERIERFDIDPFWTWHTVDAFETDHTTVVDLCAYPELDLEGIGDGASDNRSRAYLERLTLSPGKATRHRLWDTPCEFPSIADPVDGERYSRAFFHLEIDNSFGIGSFNPATGRQDYWLCPEDHEPGEPTFAPSLEDPKQGWIMSLIGVPEREQSYLAIIDSERIEDGPVARVWFDQRIPMTFHGSWVNDVPEPITKERPASQEHSPDLAV